MRDYFKRWVHTFMQVMFVILLALVFFGGLAFLDSFGLIGYIIMVFWTVIWVVSILALFK